MVAELVQMAATPVLKAVQVQMVTRGLEMELVQAQATAAPVLLQAQAEA